MELLDNFLGQYKNIAMAFYTFTLFVAACTAIAFRLRAMYKKRIEEIQTEAKLGQRQEFQAGYFDLQENRYDRLADRMIEIEKDLVILKHLLK